VTKILSRRFSLKQHVLNTINTQRATVAQQYRGIRVEKKGVTNPPEMKRGD
jgi:hypothetical protein